MKLFSYSIAFGFAAVLCSSVLLSGCSKDNAPATINQDSLKMLHEDSIRRTQQLDIHMDNGPFGPIPTYNYGPQTLDTAFRFAKQHNSSDPMVVMKSYLDSSARPPRVPPHLLPARNLQMVSKNDTTVMFHFESGGSNMMGNAELRRYIRNADTIWLLYRLEQEPKKK